MTKHFFTLIISIAFTLPLLAQNATIDGQLTNKETTEPLISATIKVVDSEKGTITDFDGKYTLELSPGEYTLQYSYVGYADVEKKVKLSANEHIQLDVALEESASLLETATVTSGKYEKPLGEVTVSLEVMKPSLIENTSKATMDEALKKIPGVTVIDGQANIRGGSGYSQGAGSRVLLLIDDIPILQADAGYPNWDDVPIENIAQVEVVKGAASALYGSSALNGIVNVRTAFATSEPQTKVSAFYTHYFTPEEESFKWWDTDTVPRTLATSISHRRKIGKTDLVLGAFYIDQDSYNKNTYKQFGRTNIGLRHRVNDRLVLGLNSNVNFGKAGSFFYWESLENPFVGNETTITNRERLRYNIDPYINYYDKNNNRHRFSGRFYHVNNVSDSDQSNTSNLYYGEYQFQKKWDEIGLVSTAGLTAMGTNVSAELYGDTTFTSRNLAAYAQFDKKFGERLSLSLGLRYEYNELKNPGFTYDFGTVEPSNEKENHPVVRFGANYKAGKATFIRASWGQGYRFPTIAEKYIFTNVGGFFITPNPDLGSETGWSAEVGIKQGFKIGAFQGFADLAVFQMQYQDMIEFNVTGFGFKAVNIGDTKTTGFEFTIAGQRKYNDLEINLLSGLTIIDPQFVEFDTTQITSLDFTVAQANAQNSSSDENVLKYRSKLSFKLDLEVKYKKLSFGVAHLHRTPFAAIDNYFVVVLDVGIDDYREKYTEAVNILNFRAGFQITDQLKASLIMENSLNQFYTVRPALPGAPRNMTFRVDYAF